MTNHVKKGKQKSSVGQFGQTADSAYGKSKKMEEYHKHPQEKVQDMEV